MPEVFVLLFITTENSVNSSTIIAKKKKKKSQNGQKDDFAGNHLETQMLQAKDLPEVFNTQSFSELDNY